MRNVFAYAWLTIGNIVIANSLALAQQATTMPADHGKCSVMEFGAVGDGKTKNTAAIQKAIDATSSAGGGTVLFPAGQYVSGTLVLKNNVTLHLDNGAVLLGSTDISDYPAHSPSYRSSSEGYVTTSLLYAEKAHDIGIIGAGTIDGQGGDPVFKCDTSNNYRMRERPFIIRFVECVNVRVEGITLRNAAMWVQQYLACDNVALEGLTVLSNCNNNNDMIDIDGCHDVRINGCKGETGDDAITLKSTSPRACERVTVSNCSVATPCSGIKMGTESIGGFRDVTITNCIVRAPLNKGHCNGDYTESAIALELVDGGILERVTISNIAIERPATPIFIRLGNRARQYKPDAPKPSVGKLRDVIISNVIARGARHNGCLITGIPGHYIENVTLRDIRITFEGGGKLPDAMRLPAEMAEEYPAAWMFSRLPAYGLYARHATGLTLDNVQFDWESDEYRPALICDDVRNLHISNLQAKAIENGSETIRLRDVHNTFVRGCVAPQGSAAFLSADDKCKAISVIGNDLSRACKAFSIPDALTKHEFFAVANRMPHSNNEGE